MNSTGISVEAVLANGGWLLDDAPARHAANPESFWMPPAEDVARLGPGATARLTFALADQADPIRDGVDPYDDLGRPNLVVSFERMWLWVDKADGDEFVGVLQNTPIATHTRLVPGARIRFARSDVIDLDLEPPTELASELAAMANRGFPVLDEAAVRRPEDPTRAPTVAPSQAEVCATHGTRIERPWDFSRCLVGGGVADGVWPLFGARFPPTPQRRDCGWIFWATHRDMDEAAAADGFDALDVAQLRTRHGELWKYLALPPGWAVVLGADGYTDIYEDPELLED